MPQGRDHRLSAQEPRIQILDLSSLRQPATDLPDRDVVAAGRAVPQEPGRWTRAQSRRPSGSLLSRRGRRRPPRAGWVQGASGDRARHPRRRRPSPEAHAFRGQARLKRRPDGMSAASPREERGEDFTNRDWRYGPQPKAETAFMTLITAWSWSSLTGSFSADCLAMTVSVVGSIHSHCPWMPRPARAPMPVSYQ